MKEYTIVNILDMLEVWNNVIEFVKRKMATTYFLLRNFN